MNTSQLIAFETVYQLGSMNQAAEQLYISQPALKKQIDALEREIGIKLFERSAHGCTATAAGKAFSEGVPALIESMQKLTRQARSNATTSTVRFCAYPDMDLSTFDKNVLAFIEAFPEIRVERIMLPTSKWLHSVASGSADVCWTFLSDNLLRLERMGLVCSSKKVTCPIVCVISPDNPLASKDSVSASDLQGYEIIAGPLYYRFGGIKSYASQNNLAVQVSESAGERYELFAGCARGAVYLHPIGLAQMLKPMVSVPIKDLSVPVTTVYRKGAPDVIKTFADMVCRLD